jgi:antitoxin YefM
MRTVSYTDLRGNLKGYLDMVSNDSDALIVYRSGSANVVVLPIDEYDALKETRYLTASPTMMARLRSAEANMRQGNGVKVNVNAL